MFDVMSLFGQGAANRLLQPEFMAGPRNMLSSQSADAGDPWGGLRNATADQFRTQLIRHGDGQTGMPVGTPPGQPSSSSSAPGLWDRLEAFRSSDRGQALGDMLAGWALGGTPQQSLGYGAAMMRQGRQDRKVKDQQNQTVEWLKSKGLDPQMATAVASQPPVLVEYLKRLTDPNAELDRRYKEAQTRALEAKPQGTAEIQNFEYARQNGYQGSFNDFRTEIKRASSAANVGGNMIDLEGLPQVPVGENGIPDAATQNDFLSKMDPATANLVRGIADYRIPIEKVTSMRGGERQELARVVSQFDPTFDMSQYGARAAMRKSLTSGEYSKSLNAANLLIQHTDAMMEGGRRTEQ
jgi:hypothetical protein